MKCTLSNLLSVPALKCTLLFSHLSLCDECSLGLLTPLSFPCSYQVLYSTPSRLWRLGAQVLEESHICLTNLWGWYQWLTVWCSKWKAPLLFILHVDTDFLITLFSFRNSNSEFICFSNLKKKKTNNKCLLFLHYKSVTKLPTFPRDSG